MTEFLDARGDEHDVVCAVHPDLGRVVYFDDEPFTPQQAGEIGAELLKASTFMLQPMIPIPGGAAR